MDFLGKFKEGIVIFANIVNYVNMHLIMNVRNTDILLEVNHQSGNVMILKGVGKNKTIFYFFILYLFNCLEITP